MKDTRGDPESRWGEILKLFDNHRKQIIVL